MTDEELEKRVRNWCYRLRKEVVVEAKNAKDAYMAGAEFGYKNGYIAGAKENGTVWHDLRKNPNDLPPEDKDYEGLSIDVLSEKGKAVNYSFEDKKWSDCHSLMFTDVLAWSEIPKWEPEPIN